MIYTEEELELPEEVIIVEEEEEEMPISRKSTGKTKTRTQTEPRPFNQKIAAVDLDPRFLENAPKLNDLLVQLKLNSDMRHVIYTRYNKHHGVRMLAILLTIYGYNVYSVHKHTNEDIHIKMIDAFNEGLKPAIYITSMPMIDSYCLYDVSHFHLLDSGFENFHLLMDETFKYRLYKGTECKLIVHNYVSRRRINKGDQGKLPSADEVLYGRFINQYGGLVSLWKNKIQRKGNSVTLGNNGYLYFNR